MALSKKRCIAVLSFDYRRTTTLILNLVLKKVILLKLAMNSATKVCLMQSRQVPHFLNAIFDNLYAFHLRGRLAAAGLCQFVSLLRLRMVAKIVCLLDGGKRARLF